MKIIEREPLEPYDAHEEKLKRQICRPDNPDDPYEATLREFLAVYTIIARRVSRQLFEEEIAVTGIPYDMRSKTDRIPDTLTAHLRLTREIRAQHRFLNDYLKKPMPTEDTDQDQDREGRVPPRPASHQDPNREASTSSAPKDREGRVHSGTSQPRPDSNGQHPLQSAKPCNTYKKPGNEVKPKSAQQPTQPPKPEKTTVKPDTQTTPRPVILLPEPAPFETQKIAAARNNPDQPTREEFLRDAQHRTSGPNTPQPASRQDSPKPP